MANKSAIEWTDATWNPTTGCTKVSDGCKNCYAEKVSLKLYKWGVKKYKNKFTYTEHENDLDTPIKWKKPKKIFVNSMSDLFHENATNEFIDRVFHTMLIADHHIYQILTKRPKIMKQYSIRFKEKYKMPIPPHIFMGTSVENQGTVHRIKDLQDTVCYSRFISFEPLLGDINNINIDNIDWCIIGGESGPNYRPVQKEWIVNLINQCQMYNTSIFFKQWGGPRPKSGGREINGKLYNDTPELKVMNQEHQNQLKLIQNGLQLLLSDVITIK